jgi:hypothetical protein
MQYIIQQLRDIGFSESEIQSFLTLIYTNYISGHLICWMKIYMEC